MPAEEPTDPMDELWQTELFFYIEEARREQEFTARLQRMEEAYALIARRADMVFEQTGFYHPEMGEKLVFLRSLIDSLHKYSKS